jgi:hypothetical protein
MMIFPGRRAERGIPVESHTEIPDGPAQMPDEENLFD